jgi:hypothetical protein
MSDLSRVIHTVLNAIQPWQTLVAAMMALFAAGIAWVNATRMMRSGARLEAQRRSRKLAALQAALPLTLSEISDYSEQSARALARLYRSCVALRSSRGRGRQSLASTSSRSISGGLCGAAGCRVPAGTSGLPRKCRRCR